MFGAQIIWNLIPFGPIPGGFMPITDFSCSAGVKIENDQENGRTRVTGRVLQTCDFTIKVSRATGLDPRVVFDTLDLLKGVSGPLIVSTGAGISLANNILDSLQTSDWSKYLTLDGAAELAKSLLLGSSLGGVSFKLVYVEIVSEILLAGGEIHTADIHLGFVEDAAQRQPGGLKVYINGKDITCSISVTGCVYETHAGGEADSLHLRFADTRNEWASWTPAPGDMVKITDGVINSGDMYIESLKPEGGQYSLVAYSVPKTALNKRSRSFETISLPQLAKRIADDHGLTVKNYGVAETRLPFVKQDKQTDLAFLAARCRLAGASFLVFNKELCLYDEKSLENREASKTITIPLNVDAKFTDDTRNAYASAEVTNAVHTGTAADKTVSSGKTYSELIQENVAGLADLNKMTGAILRSVNKGKKIGEICMSTQRELAAGSVINLLGRGWQGKAFVYRCRHDLKMKKTRFWVRKPLDY